jgi:hypothetical protein
MTIIGHSLIGATLAVLFSPALLYERRKSIIIGAFIFVAYIPDLPLPGWGHWRYHISHSVFVNLLLIGPTVLVMLYLKYAKNIGSYAIILAVPVAWLSHFVLDSLYNHGQGVGIFWPFSANKLALPVSWFSTLKATQMFLSLHNLKVFLIELLVYVPIFSVAYFVRKRFAKSHVH